MFITFQTLSLIKVGQLLTLLLFSFQPIILETFLLIILDFNKKKKNVLFLQCVILFVVYYQDIGYLKHGTHFVQQFYGNFIQSVPKKWTLLEIFNTFSKKLKEKYTEILSKTVKYEKLHIYVK